MAFIDSDCVPEGGWLEPLLAHFNDPMVAAVAPLILPVEVNPPTTLTRYEAVRSSLDRGGRAGARPTDEPDPLRAERRPDHRQVERVLLVVGGFALR